MSKNIVQFFREVRQEGQKVTWPTRKETTTTTIVVFIMIVVISLFLMFTDWVVASVIEFVLGLGR